jgi:glyoxylase-like metal-dependent hydrolase (beta-lactamase superfamily II)
MTFHGTNTYLVGSAKLVVIDPGPLDQRHLKALLAALDGRHVSGILLTHGHRDHSDLAVSLQNKVGAPIFASPRYDGPMDRHLEDGSRHLLGDTDIEVIATPGHSVDHLSFALPDTSILFSGDHVMAWSTSVIVPPDGRIRDYLASLDRLMRRSETRYLPGHGGPVERPQPLLRALRTHRRMRESAVLQRLAVGPARIGDIVADLYRDLDTSLTRAAALSTRAHLDDLVERGLVESTGDRFQLTPAPTPPA